MKLHQLILKDIMRRKKRVLCTVLGIIIAAMTVVGVSTNATAGEYIQVEKYGANLSIIPGNSDAGEIWNRINGSSITWGINLNGLDSGRHIITAHGRYESGYISPTTAELDYFGSKGMTVIRLPFRWERLQHSLYGELDPVDIGYIDDVVDAAAERGMKVILDPHNFGRYRNLNTGETYTIGTSKLPDVAFADFWQKMADHYKGNPGVYGYGLMNEPHDMPNGNNGWANSCQLAIDAIREVDTTTTIIVPGNHWSNASYWQSESYMLKDLVDPNHNLLFEAHEYLDADMSGTYQSKPESVSLDVGPNRYAPFIEWLRANGKKGIVGEIGVVSGQGWLERFDRTLAYLSDCDDVIVSIEYWGAGPWWGKYPLSIEPNRDGSAKPQMDILSKYIYREVFIAKGLERLF